jgi:hypothetical protein
MGRGKLVTAPDGGRWSVRRRWLDRPFPSLRKRFRTGRNENLEDNVIGGLWNVPDVSEGWASLAVAAAVLLIVFVALPLLGVALELIALIFVLCSGMVGRVVLGRPWTVEAVERGGRNRSFSFPVKGWRRAGEAAAGLAREIAAGGRPEDFVAPGRR